MTWFVVFYPNRTKTPTASKPLLPSPSGKMAKSAQTPGHPQTAQIKGNLKADIAQVTGATEQHLVYAGCR